MASADAVKLLKREPAYIPMTLDPKRTVAELKELRALTGDENGAQRVAWTDTWLKARDWFTQQSSRLAGGTSLRRRRETLDHTAPASRIEALVTRRPSGFGAEWWMAGRVPRRAGALEVLRGFRRLGRPPVTIRAGRLGG